MVKFLEGKRYEEWLRCLGLFSPEQAEGRSHGGLQLPRYRSREAGTELCSLVTGDRTWGNGMGLTQGRVRRKVLHPESGWAWTGSPGQWSWHRACWRSRGIWTMLSNTWFDFGVVTWRKELDSIIHIGFFLLRIFCDFINWYFNNSRQNFSPLCFLAFTCSETKF